MGFDVQSARGPEQADGQWCSGGAFHCDNYAFAGWGGWHNSWRRAFSANIYSGQMVLTTII
jgi:hypothetical protein